MNKSLLTNLAALLIVLAGLLLPGNGGELLLSMGLYALSGALTNWLAVHMLFERVPGFYGSGVIPARFGEFKDGIRNLIMSQFFNADNVQQFFEKAAGRSQAGSSVLVEGLVDRVDFNKAFDGLMEVIMQSSFAGMLTMLGGGAALQPLRAPFVLRMQTFLRELGQDDELVRQLALHSSAGLLERVEEIVDRRLDELTPQLVKEIIQAMIHKHLGWLVVWGGVVGGMIGLFASLFIQGSFS